MKNIQKGKEEEMEGHRGESRHRRHSRSRYDLQVLDSPYRSCSTPLPLL